MRSSTLALVGLLVITSSHDANAYCRTTTCDPSKEDCNPPPGMECTDVGMPLYWPNQCVGFNLQQDASPQVPFDTFTAVTRRAFSTWLTADCGDGRVPGIEVHDLGPIACDAAEYNQYAGNANIIMFRSSSWPYVSSSHTLALTTVTFNTENAQIYDVDIEINAAQIQITTSDDNIEYDLESILTHELGHFFGLAHSKNPSATMYTTYKRGTTDLRTLAADDKNGICEIYPPDREAGVCVPTPRRGLKLDCGDGFPPEEGGCGCTIPGASQLPWHHGAWLLVLGLLAARNRRRLGR